MDDKPLDLRDKIAIEILNGILAGASGATTESIHELHKAVRNHYYYFDKDNPDDKDSTHKGIERVCRYAYSIADIMRKVRLDTFK